jgi:hypothetical protein
VVPNRILRTELEALKVCDPLVIREEVFASTTGFGAATSAFVIAPYVVAPFNFVVTLDPIPDPNVDWASKEQELPIFLEVILTFY